MNNERPSTWIRSLESSMLVPTNCTPQCEYSRVPEGMTGALILKASRHGTLSGREADPTRLSFRKGSAPSLSHCHIAPYSHGSQANSHWILISIAFPSRTIRKCSSKKSSYVLKSSKIWSYRFDFLLRNRPIPRIKEGPGACAQE